MIKFILTVVVFVVFFYCFVSFYLFFKQDSFIFFPSKISDLTADILVQYASSQITFKDDEVSLQGWFINKGIDEHHPLIIYYGGNAEEVSANLYDLDNFKNGSFLFVNYRGYGESSGKPSEKALYRDALYIYDEMVKNYHISPQNIVLMGRSLGSAIATYIAVKREVRATILVTPFDSMLSMAKSIYPYYPVSLLLKHKFDALSQAAEISSPLLAILARHDEIVPTASSLNLVKAWRGITEIVFIEEASHNDISGYPSYWKAINLFLAKL